LQLLGFDVDVINSVHFSNHTGYPAGVEGDVLKGDQLRSILNGLQRNGLLNNTGHVLTGYIGSASFLFAIVDVIQSIRHVQPTARFVCDPVLGDKGEFYVPRELVPLYQQQIIPLADVLTPNQFEAEQLTGIRILSLDDAKKACAALHDLGPSLVIITSLELASPTAHDDEAVSNPKGGSVITILASQQEGPPNRLCNTDMPTTTGMWRIDCPIIPGHFTGTGDLCAAMLLAHSSIHSDDLPLALEKTVGTMYHVIQQTHLYCVQPTTHFHDKIGITDSQMIHSRELRLVQSKNIIENPPIIFRALKIA
jgi:pyridoxine kinase